MADIEIDKLEAQEDKLDGESLEALSNFVDSDLYPKVPEN
jgi:hypothetical protein